MRYGGGGDDAGARHRTYRLTGSGEAAARGSHPRVKDRSNGSSNERTNGSSNGSSNGVEPDPWPARSNFGRRLRHWRRIAGLTQADLGRKLAYDHSFIS